MARCKCKMLWHDHLPAFCQLSFVGQNIQTFDRFIFSPLSLLMTKSTRTRKTLWLLDHLPSGSSRLQTQNQTSIKDTPWQLWHNVTQCVMHPPTLTLRHSPLTATLVSGALPSPLRASMTKSNCATRPATVKQELKSSLPNSNWRNSEEWTGTAMCYG